jgi:hypothetical protein
MQISGEWFLCDDGVVRPTIRGYALARDGSWQRLQFLVDTGADRTVFNAAVLALLDLQLIPTHEHLGGVGGLAETVIVETQIRLTPQDGGKVVFRGQFAGFTGGRSTRYERSRP